ncbi:MAG: hypothetical protein GKS03_15420 [Alphaproteobacteria bacterium]|nr:hypothetical protein [Alphaproteobacteria bacterium]
MNKPTPSLVLRGIAISLFAVFQAALVDVGVVSAQAPVFISPQRVELFDNRRSEVLTVTNRTENTASYELALEDYSMSDKGVTVKVESLDYSARRLVRFSPRRFTLQPGQTQTIRVLGRRSGQLSDGTYRSHLVFRETANDEDLGGGDSGSGNTSFGIGFRFNIAIPVVVSVGESEGAVFLEEAEVVPEGVAVKFKREGNSDAVARVSVRWEKPNGKREDVVSDMVIRIYRERDWIERVLKTAWPGGEPPREGKLIITLSPESRSETDVLDELIAPLS